MKIEIKRFGQILTSRPEGREAALLLLANELKNSAEDLELDFDGVLVMTPSWLGEFVQTLNNLNPRKISCLHLENASVRESVKMTPPFEKSGS